jgi:dUTP pyrophosphatase
MTENAFAPVRSSEKAAGVDLFSAYNTVIPSKGKGIVKTDLKISLPEECYGRIAPRSGMAAKNFIDVGAGVIDADYRGPLNVLLFNFGEEDFQINKGERIAQLICERILIPDLKETDSLDTTNRGIGGFGSTGK